MYQYLGKLKKKTNNKTGTFTIQGEKDETKYI